jgi:hypothetical protein
MTRKNKKLSFVGLLVIGFVMLSTVAIPQTSFAAASSSSTSSSSKTKAAKVKTLDQCGDGNNKVNTSINIGCVGKGNPITDLTFAIIRFLSNGAALALVGSLVYGGIQFTLSRGDPQATAQALNRIKSVAGALLLFIFAYAILNYIIPGQILK